MGTLSNTTRIGLAVRRLTLGAAVVAAVAGNAVEPASAGAASVSTSVVLGAASFAPNGEGFGTARPSVIFNGGVPSGLIRGIRWSSWGGRIARGSGMTSIYKPGGGYYRTPVRAKIKAYRIGRCYEGGPRAYLRMKVRVPSYPGGPLGRWFLWSGARRLC